MSVNGHDKCVKKDVGGQVSKKIGIRSQRGIIRYM